MFSRRHGITHFQEAGKRSESRNKDEYIEDIWNEFDPNHIGWLNQTDSQNFLVKVLKHFNSINKFTIEGYNEVF